MKLPTSPNPVTGAPVATIGPPPLNTTQTSPFPATIVGWSTKRNRPRRSSLVCVFELAGFAILAMRLKLNPPSVLSATGTVLPTLKRYVRNRLPNSSKDKLGSQHAAPRLSLFPMILLVQVEPPSKLTAANMPAAGTTTLLTITILFGLVGLTAIVSSDSLLESWLTSMFLGVVCGLASSGKTRRAAVNPSTTKEARSGFFDFIETSDVFESGKSSSCSGRARKVIWENPR